ncbi:MAG: haloacid dehalogenase [Chloroflexi bacterium]|nr:haloacid dehalogenase [Chloroflexota bacterium]
MTAVQTIIEEILQRLEEKNQIRDDTLQRSRELIRTCGLVTRAVHRHEMETAAQLLEQARQQARAMVLPLKDHPDLYYTGYTGDALKEWVEAEVLFAIVNGQELPRPETLDVPDRSYLGGLAEAATELRRHILDLLRRQELTRAEELLRWMDDIYDALILVDYPDAITGGLRRAVDVLRGVLERTRGDVTLTWQHERLTQALYRAMERGLGE